MSRRTGSRGIGLPSWDLVGAVALVLLYDVVLVLGLDVSLVRVALGLPLLLVVPGYVIVAALYPSAVSRDDPGAPRGRDSRTRASPGTPLTTVERIALSVATTIAVVASIGLAASVSPWNIATGTLAVGITTVTVLGAVAAAVRRTSSATPAHPPSVRELLPSAGTLRPRPSTTYALNVLLALSVIAAVGAVGYAADDGGSGERFTEFAVLSENDNGELVVDDHPTEFAPGESEQLHLRIDNHEGQTVEYTVVVLLEEVEVGNESTTIVSSDELDRIDVAVDDNASRTVEYEVTPTATGDELRLSFLLYAGAAPESPDRSSADSALHLWITASDDE